MSIIQMQYDYIISIKNTSYMNFNYTTNLY